ncbi:hypothetical protein B6U81_00610 [Thermoplasmatales archaeon ex4484_30]|nr:MAG: hypothetical protein B6U81_00610 [Thermoplasmatales archaeon ex4484_30]
MHKERCKCNKKSFWVLAVFSIFKYDVYYVKAMPTEYEEILKILAPCGIDCSHCYAYEKGKIKELSKELLFHLGGFDELVMDLKKFMPAFKNYDSFKEVLVNFSKGDCKGCRNSSFKGCAVKACCNDKKIDFCFQCDEYPCKKSGFDERLYKKWRTSNDKMKEVGVEAYYEKQKKEACYP